MNGNKSVSDKARIAKADYLCAKIWLCIAALLAALLVAQAALRFDGVRLILSVTERLEGRPISGDCFCIRP
ncbi:hypothetical protein BG53_01520 [Paenibacillus darwinianus]|uniref:Uncharacterized protein n=1 Tax=Paenibacillus darwinianus TaxID=1380763 RepID=A0A9W5W8A6_9BACL|nr:hypothetical protein BG52_10525 [Paenibacillus darwinianus]EXX92232.1 hypothetical protein BG53_01520 [Paenibacillus darwinianus]EXX92340.1 hypothetical protein CH50_11590 [Paenibacillus darwinianus]